MRRALVNTMKAIALLSAATCEFATPRAAMAYIIADRWQTTASGAVLQGRPITLTWSLAPDGTPIPDREPSSLVSFLDECFGVSQPELEFTQRAWFPVLESAFDRWSSLGGITFAYEPHDDGAPINYAEGALGVRSDVRLAAAPVDGPGGTLASSQYPDGGDIVLDADERSRFSNPEGNYLRLRNVLMHEIGHALGLDHVVSSDANFLMETSLNLSFDGPQIDDVRGLHYLFGDRYERSNGGAGNNNAVHATPLGVLSPASSIALGADGNAASVSPTAVDFVSISGLGDVDFFSFDISAPLWLDVDLTPRGGRFRQGEPGSAEVLIDANASSNLMLSLYDGAGALVDSVDNKTPGGSDILSNVYLPAAGRYFIRINGSRERAQLYELTIRAPAQHAPEPASLSLAMVLLCAGSPLRRLRKRNGGSPWFCSYRSTAGRPRGPAGESRPANRQARHAVTAHFCEFSQ
jgi:serralysin